MKRFLFSSFLTGTFFMVFQFGAHAQFGTIDNTFVPPSGNDALNNAINVTALQTDGKILIGGGFSNFIVGEVGLGRLNADGTKDTSFDPEISGSVRDIKLQSDGKILVCGGFDDKVIHRLNSNGSIDHTFDLDASIDTPLLGLKMEVLPNGKILFAVNTFSNFCKVFRLNSDGTIDNTFSQIGSGNFESTITALKVLSNGKILVGGAFTDVGGFTAYKRMVLLNSNGTPDNTFSSGFNIADGIVYGFDEKSDGKIVVVGTFTQVNGATRNRVMQLNADGTTSNDSPDPIFGAGFNIILRDVKILSSGKMIFVGNFTNYNGTTANRIICLNGDGSVDSGFGITTGIELPGNGNVDARHIMMQPDNKIVVSGNFTKYNGSDRVAIARINGECFVNNSVSVSGIQLTANQSGATYQWIDCNNNNAPIDGATGQSFTPTANGSYAVVVTVPGCDATSECFAITSVSIDNEIMANMIVYPNPANNIINIQNIALGANITITDISGRVVYTSTASNELMSISTENWSNGLYLVQTELNGAVQQEKVVVQK